MRRVLTLAVTAVLFLAGSIPARATTIALYADTAPNAYGSPDYAPWAAAAKADVVAGTFINMQSGTYPGTLNADPLDMIVYSTGDLGKRLSWIYWLPGTTVDALKGHFQVRDVFDWQGASYTYDWATGTTVDATADAGWSEPTRWENYAGGVIGIFGDAQWAYDDLAAPFDTYGNPYDETDAADIAALRSDMLTNQTFWRGDVRLLGDPGATIQAQSLQTQSLQVDIVNPVPEPATVSLLALGLSGIVAARRRRK